VKLNIGGRVFITHKSTLISKGENFFSKLLSGMFGSTKDENGAYFIDRNGDYFVPILDFLRTGQLVIPSSIPREGIEIEADFYQIKLPPSQIPRIMTRPWMVLLPQVVRTSLEWRVVKSPQVQENWLDAIQESCSFRERTVAGVYNLAEKNGWTVKGLTNYRDMPVFMFEK